MSAHTLELLISDTGTSRDVADDLVLKRDHALDDELPAEVDDAVLQVRASSSRRYALSVRNTRRKAMAVPCSCSAVPSPPASLVSIAVGSRSDEPSPA